MRILPWGIVGCGDVTERKSGPAFYTLPQTRLIAVMRRNAEAAADYARRHGVSESYGNADAILNHAVIRAVYVATPPESHADLTIRALRAGKAVYVEKPMARTVAECRAMVEASRESGSPLFVAYYRREMSYFKRVKEIVESGRLGRIRMVNVTLNRAPLAVDLQEEKPWRLRSDISGGGYFVDMGSHQIDLLLWLFGSVKHVDGFATNRGGLYEVEDTVDMVLKFDCGVSARGSWNFVALPDEEEDSFEIIGSRGTLRFSTFSMEPIRLETAVSYDPLTAVEAPEVSRQEMIDDHTVVEIFDEPKPEVVEMPMIAHVSDMILSGESDSQALADAVEVTRIIEKILKQS